jgi:hypothetical protein
LLVAGVAGATAVYAQEPANTRLHGGPGGGHGHRLGDVELEAVGEVLDMTTDEVSSALQNGQTLQDLADEAGVDIEDVRAAIQAVHETEMRDRIEQAVADGTMTQEKADWLLEGLDKGFLDGPGGFGLGFGGRKGHGFGNSPTGQPPATNSQ